MSRDAQLELQLGAAPARVFQILKNARQPLILSEITEITGLTSRAAYQVLNRLINHQGLVSRRETSRRRRITRGRHGKFEYYVKPQVELQADLGAGQWVRLSFHGKLDKLPEAQRTWLEELTRMIAEPSNPPSTKLICEK